MTWNHKKLSLHTYLAFTQRKIRVILIENSQKKHRLGLKCLEVELPKVTIFQISLLPEPISKRLNNLFLIYATQVYSYCSILRLLALLLLSVWAVVSSLPTFLYSSLCRRLFQQICQSPLWCWDQLVQNILLDKSHCWSMQTLESVLHKLLFV